MPTANATATCISGSARRDEVDAEEDHRRHDPAGCSDAATVERQQSLRERRRRQVAADADSEQRELESADLVLGAVDRLHRLRPHEGDGDDDQHRAAGETGGGAKNGAPEERRLRRGMEARQVGEQRGRHPLEDEDGDPDEHRGREDEPGHLADVLAAAEHHEQRPAVHEHLVGDRDHGGRPGERDRGADVERLPRSGAGQRRQHPAADDDRQQHARGGCGDHGRGREIPRGDGDERQHDHEARGAVGDEQQRVTLEPADAGADAAEDVGDAVRRKADEERADEEAVAEEELVRQEAPAGDAGDPDHDSNDEIDAEHRPQHGAHFLTAGEPVGERARRRLLERPEENDHEQEERRPENGHETVGLRPERAGREDVVGVGEDTRRERCSRQQRRAVEGTRRARSTVTGCPTAMSVTTRYRRELISDRHMR